MALSNSADIPQTFEQDREKFRQILTAQPHRCAGCHQCDADRWRPRTLSRKRCCQHSDSGIFAATAEDNDCVRCHRDRTDNCALILENSHYVGAHYVKSCAATTTPTSMITQTASIRWWISHLKETQVSVSEYANVEARRLGIQVGGFRVDVYGHRTNSSVIGGMD